jgi:hypothetical protein
MKQYRWFLLSSMIFIVSCGLQESKSPFTIVSTEQGVEILENEKPVFFYQKLQKSIDGKYICNNYLHPLYSLNGDTLTEEFPEDHPYHRGIFWAWHQIYIGGKSVGDAWIMENIEQEVVNVQTNTNNHSAQLQADVNWKSPLFENSNAFISERTTITVHPLQNSVRKIDFEIALKALVPSVEIGGSDDEKGYGGFCARLKLPEDLTFTSANGSVIPENLQIEAGSWMDFSATFGQIIGTSGVSILCHPKTLNYPAPWILRSETSMQNIVFPGRKRIVVPTDKPLILFYRMIIHDGNANSIDLVKLQSEFEETEVGD